LPVSSERYDAGSSIPSAIFTRQRKSVIPTFAYASILSLAMLGLSKAPNPAAGLKKLLAKEFVGSA